MNSHTFRAPNLKIAYEEVQRELGPEALIVSVRQVMDDPAWQVWRKPGVEVIALPPASKARPAEGAAAPRVQERWTASSETFLVTPPGEKTNRPGPDQRPEIPSSPAKPKEAGAVEEPCAEPAAGSERRGQGALGEIHSRLVEQRVDPALVHKLATTSARTLSSKALEDRSRVSFFVRKQLEACIRTTNGGGVEQAIVMVGARGSGKTSTIAKLAAHYRHRLGKEVTWVCADTVRAGAIAEARIYAESLGVPLQVVYSPEELGPVTGARKRDSLMLIDTAGCNPRSEANLVELGAMLTEIPKKTVYCITPATGKESDLAQALSAFKPFGVSGLIVTKMDETNQYGDIFNLAWRTQMPLRYFTKGPRAYDDLDPGMASILVLALMGDYK
jgi:flagellar biosynthesis protein FlhF